MASKQILFDRAKRLNAIREALSKFPGADLKEFSMQIAIEFNCTPRKALEDIRLIAWEIANKK